MIRSNREMYTSLSIPTITSSPSTGTTGQTPRPPGGASCSWAKSIESTTGENQPDQGIIRGSVSIARFVNVGEKSSQRVDTSDRAALVAIKIVESAACEGCRVGICAGRSKAVYLLNVGQTICESGRSKEKEENESRFSTIRGAHLWSCMMIVGNEQTPLSMVKLSDVKE